jgi:hypothetical protein
MTFEATIKFLAFKIVINTFSTVNWLMIKILNEAHPATGRLNQHTR